MSINMKDSRPVLHIVQKNWGRNNALYITTQDGNEMIEPGLIFKPIKDHTKEVEPTMYLDDDALQALMDDLWAMGIRPIGVQFGDDTKQAMAAHLKLAEGIAKAFMHSEGYDVETGKYEGEDE
jgi:hypothetical protein